MFVSYHVRLEERSKFPAGTYFAIMPRPLLRDTEPVAVVIPEPDPPEDPSSDSSKELSAAAEESDTHSHRTDDTVEAFRRNSDDFDLRKTRIRRPFTIASPDLEELCRVEPKSAESAHYVYAPDGTPLARIRRSSGRVFPWPRRVRWYLEVAHGDDPPSRYSAPQGTIRAWTSFIVFSPLWVALIIFRLVSNVIGLDDPDFVWDVPVRAKWRAGICTWGLDYHGVGNTYYINTETMDARVAYAQAIIHSWTPRIEKKSR